VLWAWISILCNGRVLATDELETPGGEDIPIQGWFNANLGIVAGMICLTSPGQGRSLGSASEMFEQMSYCSSVIPARNHGSPYGRLTTSPVRVLHQTGGERYHASPRRRRRRSGARSKSPVRSAWHRRESWKAGAVRFGGDLCSPHPQKTETCSARSLMASGWCTAVILAKLGVFSITDSRA
jgi:hypothetical protein